jgi:hypothetical protein
MYEHAVSAQFGPEEDHFLFSGRLVRKIGEIVPGLEAWEAHEEGPQGEEYIDLLLKSPDPISQEQYDEIIRLSDCIVIAANCGTQEMIEA